jgi:hypothetical protein
MAFGHGKNTEVLANGYDLTGYLNNINLAGNADVAETSVFGLSSKTYVVGLMDAVLSGEGLFDGAAAAVDAILQAAFASESVEWTWYALEDTAGLAGYGIQAINNAYAVMSTKDDAVRISVGAQSTVGMERVLSLHALGAETADWEGTTLNHGAASANGGSAYLQVTAATGTIEVSIRHSTDNFVASDDELVAFTAVTGRTSERKTFTGAVRQYVRGVATIAGGETITFNIGFCRK